MNFISIYGKMSEDPPVLQEAGSLPPSHAVFPGKLNLKVID